MQSAAQEARKLDAMTRDRDRLCEDVAQHAQWCAAGEARIEQLGKEAAAVVLQRQHLEERLRSGKLHEKVHAQHLLFTYQIQHRI